MGWATHLAAWGLVESARLVDVAPWLVARVPAPNGWVLLAYYAGWVVVLGLPWARSRLTRHGVALQRGRSLAQALCVASGVWILSAPVVTSAPDTQMTVTFIDVGQGDATLVQFPLGHSLLVDAGGAGGSRFDIGRRVVVPAIWAQGVRRLSYLLVTHGDADHLNGAEAVVRDLRPLEVWEGVPVPLHEPLAALRRTAAAAGASWRVVQRGDRLTVDGVDVCVWHPPLADWERQRVRNDDSVVIELRHGDVSIVLPGDVEDTAEQTISPLLPDAVLRILQAPHHGSVSSAGEAFLRAARPSLGVVSVGRGNRFGHPHQVVLRRFRALGIPVVRTDVHGAITATTDGHTVRVVTFTGKTIALPAGPQRAVR
jgi:competence protein ComEC